MEEILIVLALSLLALAIVLPILALALVVVLWRRVTRLKATVEQLGNQIPSPSFPETGPESAASDQLADVSLVLAVMVVVCRELSPRKAAVGDWLPGGVVHLVLDAERCGPCVERSSCPVG